MVIVGFMGAGKTTVGLLSARLLGWSFRDLDDAVEADEAVSIALIFAERGEDGFRQAEARALRRLLATPGPKMLALGGGAVESAANRELLAAAPHLLRVHLDVSLADSLARCAAQGGSAVRPLLADREGLQARFERRRPHFDGLADATLPAAGPAEQVAERLAALVRLHFALR